MGYNVFIVIFLKRLLVNVYFQVKLDLGACQWASSVLVFDPPCYEINLPQYLGGSQWASRVPVFYPPCYAINLLPLYPRFRIEYLRSYISNMLVKISTILFQIFECSKSGSGEILKISFEISMVSVEIWKILVKISQNMV